MLYGSQHHIDNISNPKGKERFYSAGIHLRDRYFANNRRISEIKEGDILSFRNAGAYYILWHLITTPDTDQPKFMDEWKRTFNPCP
jgi:diaminopimelate decarboxylase